MRSSAPTFPRALPSPAPLSGHVPRAFPQVHRRGVTYPALLSSRLVRLAPILFFELYLTGSVLVFAFGPVQFTVFNQTTLYTYLALGQLAIAMGFKLGMANPPRRYAGYISVRRLLPLTILLTLVLLPITLHYRNYGNLSLSEALADPNAAYMARLKSFEEESFVGLILARGLSAPLLALFMPLGIVYGRSMGLFWKVLWGIGMVGILALAIFSGAAMGLFDMVLVIPWMLWLAVHHRSVQESSDTQNFCKRKKSNPWMKRLTLVAVTLVVMFAGIKYFGHSRQARYQLSGNQYPHWTIGWSEELYGFPLPDSLEYTSYMICNYWSHGYEGLSLCLELPFEWSYGCGHSRLLTHCAAMLGADASLITETTYPLRLQADSGYDAFGVWHTAYPWLASDLTFFGAIVFMGWMGYLLALVWKDAVCKTNPFAVGFLVQILMFFYYIPANNGRISFPEEAIAFWGTLMLWLLTRERRTQVRHVLTPRIIT